MLGHPHEILMGRDNGPAAIRNGLLYIRGTSSHILTVDGTCVGGSSCRDDALLVVASTRQVSEEE